MRQDRQRNPRLTPNQATDLAWISPAASGLGPEMPRKASPLAARSPAGGGAFRRALLNGFTPRCRCGPQRMVIIPLHYAELRFFSYVIVPIAITFIAMAMKGGLVDDIAALWVVMFAFGVFFCSAQLWCAVRGIRSQQALEELKHFRLSDAECFDDDDREALLALIGDLFADGASGETDLERLGWHRFENVVRCAADTFKGRKGHNFSIVSVRMHFPLCLRYCGCCVSLFALCLGGKARTSHAFTRTAKSICTFSWKTDRGARRGQA